MSDQESETDGLGSLAQASRKQQLKSARTTMFVIGAITIAANLFMALSAERMVRQQFDNEVQVLNGQGLQVDDALVGDLQAQAVRSTQLSGFGFAAMGLVFVLLGIFIHAAPVACTVLGLVLYIAGWAITAAINPAQMAAGLIIKIIIVMALVKAIQAAIAYQREAVVL